MNVKYPVLLVDRRKALNNIRRMADKAEAAGAIFRPHFKTHQSVLTAELFRQSGVRKITVSSVRMADYFARHGWNDITIAFPVNLREAEDMERLAGEITLQVILDNTFTARKLDSLINVSLNVMIEVDSGYHRTGINPGDRQMTDELVNLLAASKHLKFKGFLTHAGQSYHATGKDELLKIKDDTLRIMTALKARYHSRFSGIIISYGDTPACSVAANCKGFDEIRPGNFVYYDLMQYHLGSCGLDEIAAVVACPVVDVYPERRQMVLYGGAVHLSKEVLREGGESLFGYLVQLDNNLHPVKVIRGARVVSLSQEHGIVSFDGNDIPFKPGDLAGVIPVHSCLAANLLETVLV